MVLTEPARFRNRAAGFFLSDLAAQANLERRADAIGSRMFVLGGKRTFDAVKLRDLSGDRQRIVAMVWPGSDPLETSKKSAQYLSRGSARATCGRPCPRLNV